MKNQRAFVSIGNVIGLTNRYFDIKTDMADDNKKKLSEDGLSREPEDNGVSRRDFLASSAILAGSLLVGESAFLSANAGETPKVAAAGLTDLPSLKRSIGGEVLTADSPDYQAKLASMLFNKLLPTRTPTIVVRVKNDNDVIESVKFARANGLKTSVHGGGHNWCGLAFRNGGMCIDLSDLNESTIDPAARRASAQPVISNREMMRRLGKHGLAFPTGHCPQVKMSGYLLNGGMSWNMGAWGPGCMSVESIDFVTADGKLVNASNTSHPDLFWAARGAGVGMFAVATRFHVKCFPLPKAIKASSYFYPLERLKEVVEEVSILAKQMPEFVELSIFLFAAPPDLAKQTQSSNGWVSMVAATAFGDTDAESSAALAVLDGGPMVAHALSKSVSQPTNFDALFDATGASWPEGVRAKVENVGYKSPPMDMFMGVKDHIVQAPSKKTVIVFIIGTGTKGLFPASPDMAFSMSGNGYGGIWTMWDDAKDDAANLAWHTTTFDRIKEHVSQYYVGETEIVDHRSHAASAYTHDKWQRLQEIRKKYDPDELFFGWTGGLGSEKSS